MADKKESIKSELRELVKFGRYLLYNEAINKGKLEKKQADLLKKLSDFKKFQEDNPFTQISYQKWYSKSTLVIKQILPDRLDEFRKLYILEKRDNKNITFLTYTISDYFLGLSITRGWQKEEVVNTFGSFSSKIGQQIEILNSCYDIIDSKLSDIEGVLQSELFENELESAKDILKKKHVRLAGALAGVTLETHLKKVCSNHGINFRKKNPTIADYNEELKKQDITDVATWRLIQRLADIRNLCVHAKEREPSIDEVEDLIRGCEKIIAELI
jgi:hypothetical protein